MINIKKSDRAYRAPRCASPINSKSMHRRQFLATSIVLLLASPFANASEFTKGREVAPMPKQFKAGDYVWYPQISPAGPVVIVVSIPEQQLFVFRNGVRIGRSTVSTGAPGHSTPTGVFTILEKNATHESSIYKGAEMPHMQRLTWGGVAMHTGQLPGYPASHGCVRLPEDFAAKLYQVTHVGTTVIIADNSFGPAMTTNPGLLFARTTAGTVPAGAI